MKRSRKAALVMTAFAVPAAAGASETVDYTYNSLGRLTDVSISGGPNGGAVAATRYDPAGNRRSYSVSGAGPASLAPASVSSSSLEAADSLDGESIVEEPASSDAPAPSLQETEGAEPLPESEPEPDRAGRGPAS